MCRWFGGSGRFEGPHCLHLHCRGFGLLGCNCALWRRVWSLGVPRCLSVCLSVHSTLPRIYRFVLPVMSSDPHFVQILMYYAYEIEVHGRECAVLWDWRTRPWVCGLMGLKYMAVSVRSYGTEVHGRDCSVLWDWSTRPWVCGLMGLTFTAVSVRSWETEVNGSECAVLRQATSCSSVYRYKLVLIVCCKIHAVLHGSFIICPFCPFLDWYRLLPIGTNYQSAA